MFGTRSNAAIAASLVFAVFLWGGNNVGVKVLVRGWPPVWIGCTRFLLAGAVLLAVLRWTTWFGRTTVMTRTLARGLWWRGGLSLAAYIVVFNAALQFTSASHVALYLGASPVWALMMEGWPERSWRSFQRYAAAGLAVTGVLVLFWPTFGTSSARLLGELLGLSAGVLWANYGRQCRRLGPELTGVEMTAHTMWRAGVLLIPLALMETAQRTVPWRLDYAIIQLYCVAAGGVMAFAIWNNALREWPTGRVFLFNNLIPLSTMVWAWACLGEPVTRTFWVAMLLIVTGVGLGQTNWQKLFGKRWLPQD